MDLMDSPFRTPQACATDTVNRPRQPWLAALLSFFCPGLGQLYAGRPLRAVFWMGIYIVAFWGLFMLLAWTGALAGRPNLVWWMLLPGLVLWLFNCADAYLLGRHGRTEYVARWYNHSALYLVCALCWIVMSNLAAYGMKAALLESFRVPGGAMAPTIMPEDRILVNKLAYRRNMPRRGDICVFREPKEGVPYVMRIIGLPGDEVEIRDGRPILNEQVVPRTPVEIDPVIEAFLQERSTTGPFSNLRGFRETLDGRTYITYDAEAYPEEELPLIYGQLQTRPARKVPPDHIFVMGDNRTRAKDSRFFGFVPAGAIVGRMESRFWRSFDADKQRRRP